MSLFKLLLGVFDLFSNSKLSSCCRKAQCVYFSLFIRLGNVRMRFSWEARAGLWGECSFHCVHGGDGVRAPGPPL